MNRRNAPTVLMLILATLTSWLAWQLRPQPVPDIPGPPRSDYSLDAYTLVVLDKDGRESFTVRGPALSRDPYSGEWYLNQPRFSFPEDPADPWTASAEMAWVSAHAEEVRLQRNVEILGPRAAGSNRARLHTQIVSVLPKQNLARSDDWVTITRGGSILRGKGLEVNFQSHAFHLFSEVRARYDLR